jgi:hypothetical protein
MYEGWVRNGEKGKERGVKRGAMNFVSVKTIQKMNRMVE